MTTPHFGHRWTRLVWPFVVAALVWAPRVATAQTGVAYFTMVGASDQSVKKANLDGSGGVTTVFPHSQNVPIGIAIDPVAGRVYFARRNGPSIRVGNLDGTGSIDLFASENGPRGLALDRIGGKLYWSTGGDEIRVGNMDGTGTPATLFSGETNPLGVAIDTAGGKIYWTSFDNGTIRVGNLDGTGVAATLFAGEAGPIDVAIDIAGGQIYWTTQTGAAVRVGPLAGGTASTLLSGATLPSCPGPLSNMEAASALPTAPS